METLPNEIIIRILNLLSNNDLKNICVVSKLFDRLCKEIKITLDFFLISQYNIIDYLNFSSRHFKVVKLVLPPDVIISTNWINLACEKLHHLECIAMHCGNNFRKEHLQNFFNFKNLVELQMYHMTLNADDFEEISKMTKLKKIKIRSSFQRNYTKLFKYTPNLEDLSLIGTSNLYIDDFSKLTNLKAINFSASENFIVTRHLENELINKIAKYCKKLEKLNLGYCKNIDQHSLKIILQNCNIKILKLQCYDKMDRETMENIGNLSQLKILDISHCNNNNYMEKLLTCGKIRKLYAFGLNFVNKQFFNNIGKCFNNLVNLKITFCQTDCKEVLTSLSKCKNLCRLFLRGINISPEDFDNFAICSKYYKYLDLGTCPRLTGFNLDKLNTQSMKTLNINSKNFNKQNFTDLVNRSPCLNVLTLYLVDFLDVDFFQNVCRNIKHVYVDKIELNEGLYNYLMNNSNILFI